MEIPQGNSSREVAIRRSIISNFYREWKKKNANQKPFDKMIVMEYNCIGIGIIKMTLGIRRGSHEKIHQLLPLDAKQ